MRRETLARIEACFNLCPLLRGQQIFIVIQDQVDLRRDRFLLFRGKGAQSLNGGV
ncbi:MAG: hypothetical protein JSS00_01990 [Proteobacteria bacterium]|nr:hypothetical protein [Pseudomonadota bacterium]